MKFSVMRCFSIVFFLFFIVNTCLAQVLFTVDDQEVSVDEFTRMYEKSNTDVTDYSQKSIDNYLNLFINYKVKLREAHEKGIDEDPAVLREISVYEDQLIRNEFDKKIMNELLQEVEKRMEEEVCMRHILVDIPSRVKGTKDTVLYLKQAQKIRAELLQGGSFEQLAKKKSADIDTKFTGGDLGCFTALQLSSYEIENQAYKMRKGEISEPIRTRFGYHIFEVTDRRPSNGFASATQLFVRSNATQDAEKQQVAQQLIRQAYSKLMNKESFDEVYKWLDEQQDVHTSKDEIPSFMVGSYEADFENAIFSLKEVGEISKPIKTSLGWHIFKLNSKESLPEFTDVEQQIRDKIMEDDRFFQSRKRFGVELKRKYTFKKIDSNIQKFEHDVAPGISIEGWLLPTKFDYSIPFFSIEDRAFTADQFSAFVKEQHSIGQYRDFKTYYENFETNKLMDYHKHHLVQNDDELSALMREYHDGIVLFNLMEQEIWNNNEISDADLEHFYTKNSSDYKAPDSVVIRIFSTQDSRTAEKIKKYLDRGRGENPVRKLNRKNSALIDFGEATILKEDANIDGVDLWKIGETVIRTMQDGEYQVLFSKTIQQGKPLPFNEVKGRVHSDYQKNKEQEWINSLRTKYDVEVNDSVLESLYQ